MANRSDFNTATLPRQFKRMLALQDFPDAHARGEATRLWIECHAAHRRARNRRLAARDNVSHSTEQSND